MDTPELKKLPVATIRMDGNTQARAATDETTVAEYAEALSGRETTANWPPIIVYHDGKDYWLADGFHRVLAALRAKVGVLLAEVRNGTALDARWAAIGANKTHGLKRSNTDKRRAVEMALTMHPELSDRALAEHCGVSNTFVGEARAQLSTVDSCGPRVGLDGKTRKFPPCPPPRPSPVSVPEPAAPAPKAVPRDAIGREIPPEALETWNRRQEAQDLLTQISRVRSTLRNAQDAKDPFYAELNFSNAMAHLDQAYAAVESAKPHTVCPSCQGLIGCRLCCGRKMISKFRWDTAVPSEQKQQALALALEG